MERKKRERYLSPKALFGNLEGEGEGRLWGWKI